MGHSLKLSLGGRPQSILSLRFSAAHPAWSEVGDGETGLALQRKEQEGRIWGREPEGEPSLLLSAHLMKGGGRIPPARAGHARSSSKPSLKQTKKNERPCSFYGWQPEQLSKRDLLQPPDSLAWRRKVSRVSGTCFYAWPAEPVFSKHSESTTNNS